MFKKERQKIFCIGMGKTGTTSVEKALKDFNYKMGNQAKGELLLGAYAKRDFNKIIKFCKSAEAFQDAPFSFKYTFMHLDLAFPNSKFILTVRDSDEQWYNSLVKFHSKLFGTNNNRPTYKNLKEANYRYKGFIWDVRNKVYDAQEEGEMYDFATLTAYYNSHIQMVKDYFKYKDNLLIINLSDKQSYNKLCDFLGKKALYNEFPWENKTS